MIKLVYRFLRNSTFLSILVTILFETKLASQTPVSFQDFNSSNGNWLAYELVDPAQAWTLTNGSFIGNTTRHWATFPRNYVNDMILLVESPIINFTGKSAMTLSNRIRYQTQSLSDGFQIEYSISGGAWTDLGTVGAAGSANWYNDADVDAINDLANGWSENNGIWRTATLPLPALFDNQSNVRFRYYFASDFSNTSVGAAFDDFLISNTGGTIYSQDFESGDGGWTNVKFPTPGFWSYNNTSFAGNTTNHWNIYSSAGYPNNLEGVLQSPRYNLSNNTALAVEFNLRYDTEFSEDGLRLEYSLDSIVWASIGVIRGGMNWYNNTDVDANGNGVDAWSGDNVTWAKVAYPLPSVLNNRSKVFFRFRFSSNSTRTPDVGVAIDDFTLITQYITKQTGNLSTPSTWLAGSLPPIGAQAFIRSSHVVTVPFSQIISYDLTATSGSTFNLGAFTLTTTNSLFFEPGSTFNSGTGTVSYARIGNQTLGDGVYYNLTLLGSGTKTVNNALSVKNNLNIPTALTFLTKDNVTLLSNAALTARLLNLSNASTVITGKFIVQRYVGASRRTWWQLASPFSDATALSWKNNFPITGPFTGASIMPGSNFSSMYTYNETNNKPNIDSGWAAFPSASINETIGIGKGYRAFLRQDRTTPLGNTTFSFTGTINRGDINLPVTYTTSSAGVSVDGWSFIGNPYPCVIDWNSSSWTKTRIDNAIYVWDALNSRYATFVSGVGVNGGSRYIASTQGFWVKANAASPLLTIREAVKVTNNASFFREDEISNLLYIEVVDELDNFNTAIRFDPNSTTQFDSEYDAEYLSGTGPVAIGSYNLNVSNLFSIHSLPDSSFRVPLWIKHSNLEKSRLLRFTNVESFDAKDELLLLDKFKNDSTVLTEGLEYAFELNEDANSNGLDRFEIIRNKPSTPMFVQKSTNVQLNVFPNPVAADKNFNISMDYKGFATITITDAFGKIYKEESIAFNKNAKIDAKLPAGMYLLRVKTNQTERVQKIIVF